MSLFLLIIQGVSGSLSTFLSLLLRLESNLLSQTGRPGNNSLLSGILEFDSKVFCESIVVATLEKYQIYVKIQTSIRRSDRKCSVRLKGIEILTEKIETKSLCSLFWE